MLNSDCFALQDVCEHEKTGLPCTDCRLYGEAVLRDPPREMGTDLAARLRAIPNADAPASLPWTDRELFASDEGPDEGPEIRELLEDAFTEARRRRPLPAALQQRLREVPRTSRVAPEPRKVPRWIADSRWATAACVLLTAALTLAAGDVSAHLGRDGGRQILQELLPQNLDVHGRVEELKKNRVEWSLLESRAETGASRLAHRLGGPVRHAGTQLDRWLDDLHHEHFPELHLRLEAFFEPFSAPLSESFLNPFFDPEIPGESAVHDRERTPS